MNIARISPTRPGNSNPGIVPPWLTETVPNRPRHAATIATGWNPLPVDEITDEPRHIERPIHTWAHDIDDRPRIV